MSKGRILGAMVMAAVLLLPVSRVRAQTNCVPAPSGVVGWWRGEGDASDILGGDNGTALNGVTYAAGEVGLAFVFNGAGAQVRIPDRPSLRETNALTLEAWISSALETNETVVAKWDVLSGAGQSSYSLYLDAQGRPCLALSADGSQTNTITVVASNSVPLGVWTHVAATYDGTTAQVYTNGVVQGAGVWTAGIFAGTDDLGIGGTVGGAAAGQSDSPFAGMIDEVSIYARALATSEILAIVSAGSAGKCCQAPVIQTQPLTQTAIVGSPVTLSVAATGAAPLSYQWQLGASPIPGATGASLAFPSVQLSASGAYSVTVSNLFGWAQSAPATLTVVTVVPGAQPDLINMDFADTESYLGYGAFGVSTNDVWNHSYYPWALFSAMSNLETAAGTPTGAGLTVQNGGGTWGFPFANQMYSTYCYAQDSGIITVTVTNLPSGQYDFYLYGHAGSDNANTGFEVSVGGTDYGLKATATNSSWSLNYWVEGAQYVVYRGVTVTNGAAPVTVLAHPGLGHYTQINGMQIAKATPAAPSFTLQPVSQTVAAGANVTFQAQADGTAPLAYQWSFGGANLLYATNAALTLTNVQAAAAGNYAVTVSNPIGTATSSNAVLTVGQAPAILVPPQGQAVAAGAAATFSVTASGTAPLSYQWQFNNSFLAGATASSLLLPNAQLTNAGSYSVIVSNVLGSATSATAVLVVDAPPVIVTQPQNRSVAVGATVTFSVVATGSAPLTYQWQLGGVTIPGATGVALTLANVQMAAAGSYSVAISNSFGWAQSTAATLAVAPVTQPGLINMDFADGVACVGYAAFGLSTNDVWNHSYEPWALFSAVSNLETADGTPTQAGLTVQNGGGTWGFASPNPMFGTYCYAQDNGIITVTVTNLPTGQYDFYLYGHAGADSWNTVFELEVGGNDYGLEATTTTSAWSQAQWVQGAQYVVYRAVAVTNGGAPVVVLAHPGLSGNTQINGMQIARSAPTVPSFTLQPTNLAVVVGANVTFSAQAAGTAPLSYQWSFDGTNLVSATNAWLSLTNVQFSNAGAYAITVSNIAGLVTSSNAVLSVSLPPALVQAGSASVPGGGSFTLPILLVANGDENALGFTLNFDPTMLTYVGISLGGDAAGASLLRNTNQATSGWLGAGVALEADETFPAGTQQVVLVTFTAAPVAWASATTVSFGNQLTVCQLSDPLADLLPVSFVTGSVSIAATVFEGDIAPRPNGDGSVTVIDWVLEGRYVAQLDSPTNGSEFQRADCAPRSTLGDGQITISDWVQVGRYAAGLDPLTPAGGPTNAIPPPPGGNVRPKDLGARQVRATDMALGPGQTASMDVVLAAQGDENALGFTLSFDTNALTFAGATLAGGATGATLNVNSHKASSGLLGFALALGWGNTFSAGTVQVVQVSFSARVTASSGSSPVVFTDQIVKREVSDPTAVPLTASYVNGAVSLLPPPSLSISLTNQGILLSWPLWATNFVPQQAVGDFSTALSWSGVGIAPTATTNANTLTLPLSPTNMLYRLRSH